MRRRTKRRKIRDFVRCKGGERNVRKGTKLKN